MLRGLPLRLDRLDAEEKIRMMVINRVKCGDFKELEGTRIDKTEDCLIEEEKDHSP